MSSGRPRRALWSREKKPPSPTPPPASFTVLSAVPSSSCPVQLSPIHLHASMQHTYRVKLRQRPRVHRVSPGGRRTRLPFASGGLLRHDHGEFFGRRACSAAAFFAAAASEATKGSEPHVAPGRRGRRATAPLTQHASLGLERLPILLKPPPASVPGWDAVTGRAKLDRGNVC